MNWTNLFFSPDGRIGRQDYWIAWVIIFAANFVLGWTMVVPLLGLYCWICISAKRFHDMGKSGWLAAIPVVASVVALVALFPMFGALFAAAAVAGDNEEAMAAAVMSAVGGSALVICAVGMLKLGFWIWQGVADSEPGENRYGPRPTPVTA